MTNFPNNPYYHPFPKREQVDKPELETYRDNEPYYAYPRPAAQKPMSNFEAALWMVGSLITFILLLVVGTALLYWAVGPQAAYDLAGPLGILIALGLISTR